MAIDDPFDFLTLDEAPVEAPASVQTTEEPALVPSEIPAEIPAEPSQSATHQPGYVPLAAVLDEREKRQAEAREKAEWKAKYEEAVRQPVAVPDVASDPARAIDDLEFNARLRISDRFARQNHGDKFTAAMEWGKTKVQDRQFVENFGKSEDPCEYLIAEHRKAQILERIGNGSLEDYLRAHAETLGYRPVDAANGTQQPTPAIAGVSSPARVAPPPRSIASQTAAGGNSATVISEKELFPA